MRNRMLFILVLAMVSALLFANCASAPVPTTSPKTVPPTTPAPPTPKPQVIKLNYGHESPSGSSSDRNAHQPWVKLLEEKSNGLLQINAFPNQTLFKSPQAFDAIKGGIGDLGWFSFSHYANQFTLSKSVELPFMNIPTAEKGGEIMQTLYEKYPQIRAEFPAGIKMLFIHTSDEYSIFSSKKPVRNMDDIQGMKLRTMPDPQAAFFKLLGVIPSFINSAEVYESIQKGIIEGTAANWGSIEAFRLYEVNKYFTDVIVGRASFGLVMSLSKYNSLPPEAQKAIDSVSGVFGAKFFGREHFDKGRINALEAMKKGGFDMQRIVLDEGQSAKWAEIAKPLWAKWAADRDAEGKPGTQILNDTLNFLAAK